MKKIVFASIFASLIMLNTGCSDKTDNVTIEYFGADSYAEDCTVSYLSIDEVEYEDDELEMERASQEIELGKTFLTKIDWLSNFAQGYLQNVDSENKVISIRAPKSVVFLYDLDFDKVSVSGEELVRQKPRVLTEEMIAAHPFEEPSSDLIPEAIADKGVQLDWKQGFNYENPLRIKYNAEGFDGWTIEIYVDPDLI